MRSLEPCIAACEAAAEILTRTGFVLRYVSGKSEARYYGWPDCDGLLRLAMHKDRRSGRAHFRTRPILAKITFSDPRTCVGAGDWSGATTALKVENAIVNAIGRYMVGRAKLSAAAALSVAAE